MTATDYVKQIQTKVNREIRKINKEWGVSKSQVREVFEGLGIDFNSPNQEELELIFSEMIGQFSQKEANTTSSSDSAELVAVASEQTETIEISPEENPDTWATLQPPAEEPQPQVCNELAIATEQTEQSEQTEQQESALTQSDSKKSGGIIPQSEVANMVNQAFASQPPHLQQQITEYAMERTFSNVREVQEFLEQLRGMEFRLLVETLNDHVSRRSSMITLLNEILESQESKDKETTASFFGKAYNQMSQFQKEIESKLSKQGL